MELFGFEMIGFSGLSWAWPLAIVKVALAAFILCGGGYLIMNLLVYNRKVIVREQVGDTVIVREDCARIKKDRKDGSSKLHLMRGRVDLPLPELKYFRVMHGSMRFKKVIEYLKFGENDYTPVDPKLDMKDGHGRDMRLKPIEPEVIYYKEGMKGIDEKYDAMRNFWQSYGQIILILGSNMFLIVMAAVFYFATKEYASAMGSNTAALNSASETIVRAIETLNRCNVPGVTP